MPLPTRQLDTTIEIVTPENIAFQYQLAGPFRRLAAWIIDLLIRIGALFLLGLTLMFAFGVLGMPGFGAGIWLSLFFLVDWFYGGLFETFWNGQTPGKHLLRLRVTSLTGQPINAWQAVLRNLLRAVDAMPVIFSIPLYQLGLVCMTCNDRFQRLGDLASNTMVIVEEPQRLYGVTRVLEPEAIRLAALLPANFQVTRSMARALSTYVQRRVMFAPARRAEIARHLGEPLRERFNLPLGTSHDLLLCALYHQTFIAHRPGEEGGIHIAASPFAPPVRTGGMHALHSRPS